MAIPIPHRAAVRSRPKTRASAPGKPAKYQRHELIAAVCGAVLLAVIGVLSGWAHHSLSSARPASPITAATPPASGLATPPTVPPIHVQLRSWLAQAEPSINALITARDEIVSSAANDDIVGTGAACQTAQGAVASLQHHLPSPDQALNTTLQQAISSYRVGLPYCIVGVQNRDANNIERAATYLRHANADLQAAVDILERDLPDSEPRDPQVMTV